MIPTFNGIKFPTTHVVQRIRRVIREKNTNLCVISKKIARRRIEL
jgi:hypothetical protein